eukprot:gene10980-17750_t
MGAAGVPKTKVAVDKALVLGSTSDPLRAVPASHASVGVEVGVKNVVHMGAAGVPKTKVAVDKALVLGSTSDPTEGPSARHHAMVGVEVGVKNVVHMGAAGVPKTKVAVDKAVVLGLTSDLQRVVPASSASCQPSVTQDEQWSSEAITTVAGALSRMSTWSSAITTVAGALSLSPADLA